MNLTPLSYWICFVVFLFFIFSFCFMWPNERQADKTRKSSPKSSKYNQRSRLSPLIVSLPFQSAEGKSLHSISVNIVWLAARRTNMANVCKPENDPFNWSLKQNKVSLVKYVESGVETKKRRIIMNQGCQRNMFYPHDGQPSAWVQEGCVTGNNTIHLRVGVFSAVE